MSGRPLIEVADVSKRYLTTAGPIEAVTRASLTVDDGAFCTLIGSSGCGKSTLVGMIARLVGCDTGRILVSGVPVVEPDPRRAAMVFQDPGLFPWRTAVENVEFGLEIQGVPRAERRRVATELLGPLGLARFADRYPRELSGGMRQRVAIGRALAIDAPIVLMDEPFGALDEQTRVLMGEWLLDIWRRTRKTVVFVGAGAMLGLHRVLGRAWGPILAALYAVPAVVWYPSLMLFFGLDAGSTIAFGFLLGFFPIALAVQAGIRQASPHLVTVARSFGARPATVFVRVMLPSMLGTLAGGLRAGLALAVVGVVVGEILGSRTGLGSLINHAYGLARTPDYVALVLVTLALVMASDGAAGLVERRARRWTE